jgi:hypothetical protein
VWKILYKMNNILDRIAQIADLENISIGKIEQKISASKGVLYKAIQKNTDIQSKWVIAIAENFPQYNPEWLLLGKGEKLRNVENIYMVSDIQAVYGKEEKIIESLKNEISYKDIIIAGLERENKLLWKLVDGDDNSNRKKKIG